MKPSTAILAIVALSLSALAVARQVHQAKQLQMESEPGYRPPWGWIGCRFEDVDEELAGMLGLSVTSGVLIYEVVEASPAEAAGLRRGDIIRKMDDEEIDTQIDLRRVIRRTKPGDVMAFSVVREGRPQAIGVTLGARPVPPAPKPPELPN